MTREDRWIVSLDEVRALRWQCGHCHASMSFALDQTIRIPEECPVCNTARLDPSFIADHRVYGQFVEAFKALMRYQQQNGIPATIHLEFLAGPTARH